MLVTRRDLLRAGATCSMQWFSVRLTPIKECVINGHLRAVYDTKDIKEEIIEFLERAKKCFKGNFKHTENKANSVLNAISRLENGK